MQPSRRSTERLAVQLSALNVAVSALLLIGWHRGPSHGIPLAELVGFTAVFALVGAVPIRLDFSEHRVDFTLTDAVVVSGLFYLATPWLALAAGVGQALSGVIRRSSPIKVLFNATSHGMTAMVAASTFAVLGGASSAGPGSWLAALGATVAWSAVNAGSVSMILARAESERFERTLRRSLPTAAATTALCAPLGLLVTSLLERGPLYTCLLVPIALAVAMNHRYAGAQRDEHLRVERLYEATARTAQLATDQNVIGAIADEARRLVTGTAAICCVRHGTGPWISRTARPTGVGGTRQSDMAELLHHVAAADGLSTVAEVPDRFRQLVPDADKMVLARSPEGLASQLVLAVFRKDGDDRRADRGLGETLAAFAAHGAVITANAELLATVQRSLDSQMEANQRKDEFVATISHELRTPLTVMLGAAQTLLRLEDRIERPDRERLMRSAVDQGERLRVLIEDLLLVAAAEEGRMASEMVVISTERLAEEIGSDLPEPLRPLVTVRNAAPGAAIRCDRYRFRQIITNLVQNAGKYAPGSPIEIDVTADAEKVCISVTDHGPGVPEEERERIFDRFVQLDQSSTRAQGGTGLGLFICRKLAGQLDASLELVPAAGGGCRFEMRMPRLVIRSADQAAPAAVSPVRASGLLRRPGHLSPGIMDRMEMTR